MPDESSLPDSPRRGLILINTGPGKGKTTAALGTAFRAAGNDVVCSSSSSKGPGTTANSTPPKR